MLLHIIDVLNTVMTSNRVSTQWVLFGRTVFVSALYYLFFAVQSNIESQQKVDLRSSELDKAFKKPRATKFQLRQLEKQEENKVCIHLFPFCHIDS